MIDLIKAIVLGFVQGATEFLPVSSSGHLVVVPWLLGWTPSSLLFDTVLHWGTLLAILAIFWRDFWRMTLAGLRSIAARSLADPYARLAWWIVIASVPVAITGLLFEEFFETLFASPRAAGGFLLVTALLLASSEWLTKNQTKVLDDLRISDAVAIGLAQTLALAPGVSRSGTTIAAGLVCGLTRESAARFSFLLGTPAFLGAGLLQLLDALAEDRAEVVAQLPLLALGFAVSAITGFAAIRFLLAYLRRRTLYPFAVYCLAVGISVIVLTFVLPS